MRSILLALLLLLPATSSAQSADTQGHAGDETSSLTWVLDRARELDTQTDYVPAAELFEVYAEACLDAPTASLERGSPCADSGSALIRAFELRRALGHFDAAALDVTRFREHFLYAEPRRALQIGHQIARMHYDAGHFDEALSELDALSRRHPHATARQAIVSDALRGSIAEARGHDGLARQIWRRIERRWDHDRAAIEADGPVPLEWVHGAVAEARLSRAQPHVDRFLATRAPSLRGVRSDTRWWSRVSAWLTRSRRRLAVARHALEQVYEMGSVRHSVIAAGQIGEMYGRQSNVHASIALPDQEFLLAIARNGTDRPGYDEARSHFETCVAWASNNGVAPSWAQRCEQGLFALDPESYPLQAELHGEASYHPLAHALPPGLEE